MADPYLISTEDGHAVAFTIEGVDRPCLASAMALRDLALVSGLSPDEPMAVFQAHRRRFEEVAHRILTRLGEAEGLVVVTRVDLEVV